MIRGPREDIFGERVVFEGRYSGSYSDLALRCGPLLVCWKKGKVVGGALAKECEGGRAGIGGI